MLKFILNRYLLFGLILNIILFPLIDDYYIFVYFFNLFSILFYYYLLRFKLSKPTNHYSSLRLAFEVFAYSLFFIISFNLISYYYTENFFVFSEKDAVVYHLESIKISKIEFWDGVNYFLNNWSYEDLGAVFFTSLLYKIIDSNLILNLFYLLTGIISSLSLFRIGLKFMPRKYAYLAALAYSLSSYVLWFHSSGLKESLLIFFIITSFDQYYEFTENKKIKNIIIFLLSILMIFLFRPAISFLILISIFISYIISNRKSLSLFLLTPLLIIVVFFISNYIQILVGKYVGEDLTAMLVRKEFEGMVIINLPFTISTNILSILFGPFPNIIPTSSKIILSLYSVGLIFKVLFSVLFWFAVFFILKKGIYKLYPLVFYLFLESFSLVFILEGLELRKSLTHFFIVFLIGFWFIYFYNKNNILSVRIKKRIFSIIKFSTMILFFLIVIWNFR